jgi:tetratricopeptide (TPR) repeat protein
VALAVAALVLGASGFLPLFGGPGYEASLAAGLVLPLAVALATAVETASLRAAPWEALERGLGGGAILGLVGLALAWVHGWRVGLCDPLGGTVLYLLGGGFGAAMGGAWGAVAGVGASLSPRRPVALSVLLAIAGPLIGIGVSLWRFYASAMVFAFDPFFGVFSGPLYDTVVERTLELVTYRAGSLMTLGALGVLSASLERVGDHEVRLRRPTWLLGLGGVGAALGSLSITHAGPSLGHYTTPHSLRRALGRQVVVGRCEVVQAKSILDRDARALGRDCEAHLRELEQYLGTRAPDRVTVFLFASAQDKARLMGASHTQIAKPWRSEVYLAQAGYPHPVLRHELAHVVARALGQGPFRVAGPLWGWVPDPGRIEGLAVAAAPDEDGDLTLPEEARAMLDLGVLPPLDRVFRLSFLGENSSKAYAVAGAFVAWLHDHYGANAVAKWYGGQSLGAIAAGKSLAALEGEWRASLGAVRLAPGALEAARLRFDRPAVFGRRCPHMVDLLAQEGAASLAALAQQDARETFERLLELDPSHVSARLGLSTCALRAGSEMEARARLGRMATDPGLRLLDRARAREMLADLDLSHGRTEASSRVYRELSAVTIDRDRLRQLELKASVATDPVAARVVAALLVGDLELGPNWGVAAALLGAWAQARPEDGTAHYLLGRNFFQQGRWRDGAEHLDRALERPLPLPSVELEALRLRLVVACAEADRKAAEQAYARLMARPGLTPALKEEVAGLGRRCGGR